MLITPETHNQAGTFFKLAYLIAQRLRKCGLLLLFCRKFTHFLAHFLQTQIMCLRTKIEKYKVWIQYNFSRNSFAKSKYHLNWCHTCETHDPPSSSYPEHQIYVFKPSIQHICIICQTLIRGHAHITLSLLVVPRDPSPLVGFPN